MGEASYGPAIQTKVSDEVYEKAEGEYVTTILSSSKLHMVAVDPAHRGRGHGRRLVNSAIDRLVKGGTVMIYGQFTGDGTCIRTTPHSGSTSWTRVSR